MHQRKQKGTNRFHFQVSACMCTLINAYWGCQNVVRISVMQLACGCWHTSLSLPRFDIICVLSEYTHADWWISDFLVKMLVCLLIDIRLFFLKGKFILRLHSGMFCGCLYIVRIYQFGVVAGTDCNERWSWLAWAKCCGSCCSSSSSK